MKLGNFGRTLFVRRVPAPPEPILGLGVEPPITGRAIRQLRELRVTHVRLAVSWGWYDAAAWAADHEALKGAGIEVLPLLTSPPAALNHKDATYVEDALWSFTAAFFRRHGSFPFVQVGNEWDGSSPWYGPESANSPRERGLEYGHLLRRIAPLIRGHGAKVVGMGLGRYDEPAFVRGVLETGAGSMDAAAVHVYGEPMPMGRGAVWRNAGWAGPLWVTEFGRETRSDAEQLHAWQQALSDPRRFDYERLYGFQLPADGPDRAGNGITRPDGTVRPAYQWLRATRGP